MRKILALAPFIWITLLSGCSFATLNYHDPADPLTVSIAAVQSSVRAGNTLTLDASVTGNGPRTIVWSVNGVLGGNSTYGTITQAGFYSAPDVIPSNPTVTVAATSTVDSTISGKMNIQITVPIITSITVACSPTAILNTQSTQCSSSVVGDGYITKAVTWAVDNIPGGNSAVGLISPQGVYQPPDPLPSTPVSINAISQQDGTSQGSASIGLAYPVPVLNTVTPNNLLWMSSGAQIQVSGSNFSHASSVLIGTTAIPTTFVSTSQLTATVPASVLQSVATMPLTVSTPGPGGGTTANAGVQVVGGTMSVSVQGLPSGAQAAVQVTGPGGYSTTISGTASLAGLGAGSYTVTAGAGDSSDSRFPPDQPSQSATIASLAPVSVNVQYSNGLYKGVKTLDAAGTASIAFVQDQSTFTLDPSSTIGMGLIAGDTLIIPDCTAVPGGAVVLISSASLNGAQIVVDFSVGGLGDVFSQLSLQVNQDLGADQMVNAQSAIPGVRLLSHPRTPEEISAHPETSGSPCNGNPNTFSMDDSGDLLAEYGNKGGTITGTAGIHASALVEFCPTVNAHIDLSGAGMSIGLDEYSEFDLSTEVSAKVAFDDLEIRLG